MNTGSGNPKFLEINWKKDWPIVLLFCLIAVAVIFGLNERYDDPIPKPIDHGMVANG